MVIETDSRDYFDHTKMNKEEARMFVIFLAQEGERHYDDIDKINSTIKYLKNKHDIDISVNDQNKIATDVIDKLDFLQNIINDESAAESIAKLRAMNEAGNVTWDLVDVTPTCQ